MGSVRCLQLVKLRSSWVVGGKAEGGGGSVDTDLSPG